VTTEEYDDMHHESGERGALVYRYTGNAGSRSGEFLTTNDERRDPIPAKSLYEADLAGMTAAQIKTIEANAASPHAIYTKVEPKTDESSPARARDTSATTSKKGDA